MGYPMRLSGYLDPYPVLFHGECLCLNNSLTHWEPGHPRDTRAHTGTRIYTQTNLTSIPNVLYRYDSKTPEGAGRTRVNALGVCVCE
jgi:hypothetical protein